MMERLTDFFSQHLHLKIGSVQQVAGGCINACYRVEASRITYFCKVNSASKFPHLFLREKEGLQLLKQSSSVKTPEIIAHFEAEGFQVLVLEWINEAARTNSFWENFGEQLAAMHNISSSSWGLATNNYMGSIEQDNSCTDDWILFFKERRLAPVVERCFNSTLLDSKHLKQFAHLWEILPDIFGGQQIPSLLHGDLWNGNLLCNANSKPVLIDPAVYFGHSCMDLAMTNLFGGFPKNFYNAYQYHRPFGPNFTLQWRLCTLYPLLIHLLLFGKGYLNQIENILDEFN